MSVPAVQLPTRRERQRVETRERLFRAACAEINRVGLAEAQIPRIAKDAGVARATFYFHFPAKEMVLDELVERLHAGLTDSLAEVDTHGQPLQTVIGQLLDRMLRLRAYVGESNLMREVLALHVRQAQDESVSDQPGLPAALAPHFAAASERGEIHSPIDPDRLSAILLASVFGLLLGGQRPEAELAEEFGVLADVFLRGLAA